MKSLNKIDTIEYYCHALTEKNIMYGIEPPGTKMREIIRHGEGLGGFKDGGNKWGGIGAHDVTHTDIHIEKQVMDKYIKEKKAIKKEDTYR